MQKLLLLCSTNLGSKLYKWKGPKICKRAQKKQVTYIVLSETRVRKTYLMKPKNNNFKRRLLCPQAATPISTPPSPGGPATRPACAFARPSAPTRTGRSASASTSTCSGPASGRSPCSRWRGTARRAPPSSGRWCARPPRRGTSGTRPRSPSLSSSRPTWFSRPPSERRIVAILLSVRRLLGEDFELFLPNRCCLFLCLDSVSFVEGRPCVIRPNEAARFRAVSCSFNEDLCGYLSQDINIVSFLKSIILFQD